MQTVLITGVGRGIGKAIAQKFLDEGFRVFGTVMTGSVDYVHENLHILPLDLRSSESIKSCIARIGEEVAATSERIDIVINNAGVLLDEDETTVVPDLLRQTLEVNVIGTAEFTEQIIPYVNAGGHIVMISSTAGSLERTGHLQSHYPSHYPAYKISKTALNMYMRTLSMRLKKEGITVSAVHPGWVKTDMGGEEADMTPEEAALGIYATAIDRPETGRYWFKGEKLSW